MVFNTLKCIEVFSPLLIVYFPLMFLIDLGFFKTRLGVYTQSGECPFNDCIGPAEGFLGEECKLCFFCSGPNTKVGTRLNSFHKTLCVFSLNSANIEDADWTLAMNLRALCICSLSSL